MSVFRLRGIKLKRISLVDSPANQAAVVTLFKSKNGDEGMDPEAIMCSNKHKNTKSAAYCAECGESMKKEDTDKAEGILSKLEKLFEKLSGKSEEVPAAEKREETKMDDATRVALEKSAATIADLQKQLEDTQAKSKLAFDHAEKMMDEAVTKQFVDEVASFCKNLTVKAEVLGPIIKRVANGKTTKEDADELKRILKAANEAARLPLRVVGKSGQPERPGSASDELMKQAEAIVEKSAGKTSMADAIGQVVAENPELWERHRKAAISGDDAVGEE